MTQGIYLIKNNVNGKVYIGQSKNIERRLSDHKRNSLNEKAGDYNTPLHRAFRKYGVDSFSFKVLATVDEHEHLNAMENAFMREYDSIDAGYNQIITSRNGLSKEELNKRREAKYGVSKQKLFSELTQNTFEQVASIYNVSSNTIRKWCKDYNLPHSANDYMTEDKANAFKNRMKKIATDSSVQAKKVAMLDKDTLEVVKVFNSAREAGEYFNTTYQNITRAIIGDRKTSLGYKWAYI